MTIDTSVLTDLQAMLRSALADLRANTPEGLAGADSTISSALMVLRHELATRCCNCGETVAVPGAVHARCLSQATQRRV